MVTNIWPNSLRSEVRCMIYQVEFKFNTSITLLQWPIQWQGTFNTYAVSKSSYLLAHYFSFSIAFGTFVWRITIGEFGVY